LKKILYVINVDWFFISHFLPIAIEAKYRGFEVHIACGITDKKEYLENFGFLVHPLSISRSGTTIGKELKTIYQIYKVMKLVTPEVIEFLTIKPVLYGGIIAKIFFTPKKIFYITGLGYVFINKGFKGTIVKNFVKFLYKLAIAGKNTIVITENIFDKNLIYSLNVLKETQITTIRGAGVDLNQYSYIEEDNKKTVVVLAARLLKDKGIFEYVEAAKILKNKGFEVEFELYGDIDIHNLATLTNLDLEKIKQDGFVKVYGFNSDIASVFSKANIVVLPSYREGLPKVLIEAAASGRAIVTTDVPGCRDAIEPNVTGLLCKVKDANSLSKGIEKLILDKDLRNSMGKVGRELAEKEFDIKKVIKKHFEIYEGIE
jgi:glycosyltransferase involved in cell wall biosynthesis